MVDVEPVVVVVVEVEVVDVVGFVVVVVVVDVVGFVVVVLVVDVVGVVGSVLVVDVEEELPLSFEATTASATPRPMTAASRTPIASFTPGLIPPGGGDP